MKTIIEKESWKISSFIENKNFNLDKKKILDNIPKNLINEDVETN